MNTMVAMVHLQLEAQGLNMETIALFMSGTMGVTYAP